MVQIAFVIVVVFANAVAVNPLLRPRTRVGAIVSTCAAIGVLFCPVLISHDQVIPRALALLVCTELMFKMLDYSREYRRRVLSLTPANYYRFLSRLRFDESRISLREISRTGKSTNVISRSEIRHSIAAVCYAPNGLRLNFWNGRRTPARV